MTCADILTANPLVLREDETVAEAAATLIASGAFELPVAGAQGKFLGMFGLCDIASLLVPSIALAGGLPANLRFMAESLDELHRGFREIASRRVGDATRRDAPALYSDMPEIEALRRVCAARAALAVLERGTNRLVGVLSYRDAVCALTGMAKAG